MTKKELKEAVKKLSGNNSMVFFLIRNIQRGFFTEEDYYQLKEIFIREGLA